MTRSVKIVCTVGPATRKREMLRALIRAGMDVARLNFSHGEQSQFEDWIRMIREESESMEKTVAILQDLPGPKIRIGEIQQGEVILKTGSRFILKTGHDAGSEKSVQISYSKLPQEVSAGDPIFIDDGHIRLKVMRVLSAEIETEVISGGKLRSEQGINVPQSNLSMPFLSEHDLTLLAFGLAQGVDWVALSFVRSAEDIEEVRSFCQSRGQNPKLMAKIERREALEHLEPILQSCDGVMVARGDLGVEIPVEEVPLAQKKIIGLANRLGKPVVTATQMLESMVEQPWPTRAEVADIANAVLDGTDAVMLSQETAIGKYPLEAVGIMARVISELENHHKKHPALERRKETVPGISEAVTDGACHIANRIKASIIVAVSPTGLTAQRLSAARPHVPIVVLTSDQKISRQLVLYWGVIPLLLNDLEGIEQKPEFIFELIHKKGLIQPGEAIILTGELPAGKPGSTSFIRVFQNAK
ncbi:MAG TPA: pyruvate kinase [Nitrospiria bacterium]|nr:pyruvate kinase [Nitrospiria bacterium]